MKKIKKKLGQMLLEAGAIDEIQLKSALAYQAEWGGRLGSIIIKKGFMTDKELLAVIVQQYGIDSVALDEISKPPVEALKLVRLDIAKKFCIFPLEFDGKTLLTAVADPTDLKTLDDIGFMLGLRVKPVLALESEIMRAIARYYEGKESFERDAPRPRAEVVSPPQDEQRTPDLPPPYGHMRHTERHHPTGPGYTQRDVLESLIDLLVETGVITREELKKKLALRGTPAGRHHG